MNIDELKTTWAKDSIISEMDLSREALRTPQLHSKYIDLLIDSKMKLATRKHDLARMQNLKSRYYRGELSKDELLQYELVQWQYNKPLKSEMDSVLDADEDCILIKGKIEYFDMMVYFLESIMKSIASRGWDIKAAIEFKKFQAGG
jgi:hypothetical protein